MAQSITINSEEEVKELASSNQQLELYTVIIHKPMSFSTIEGIFKRYFPKVTLKEATIGTTIFSKFGNHTSVIVAIIE